MRSIRYYHHGAMGGLMFVTLALWCWVPTVSGEVPEIKITPSENSNRKFVFSVTMNKADTSNEVNVVISIQYPASVKPKERELYTELWTQGDRLAAFTMGPSLPEQGQTPAKATTSNILFSLKLRRDLLEESWCDIRLCNECYHVIRLKDWIHINKRH